jgi:hypothetical protein
MKDCIIPCAGLSDLAYAYFLETLILPSSNSKLYKNAF